MLSILQQIPFFAALDEDTHQAIIKNIEMQYFPANYTLFKEEDLGEHMFIIKTGKVGIYKTKIDTAPLATLGSNDFFGEMALISNKPRNATAKTLEESEIFKLHKGVFQELMRTNPEIASKISEAIIDRTNENENNDKFEEINDLASSDTSIFN